MRNIVLVFLAGVLTIGTALYRWAGLHRESPPADLTVIWGDEPESLNPTSSRASSRPATSTPCTRG